MYRQRERWNQPWRAVGQAGGRVHSAVAVRRERVTSTCLKCPWALGGQAGGVVKSAVVVRVEGVTSACLKCPPCQHRVRWRYLRAYNCETARLRSRASMAFTSTPWTCPVPPPPSSSVIATPTEGLVASYTRCLVPAMVVTVLSLI